MSMERTITEDSRPPETRSLGGGHAADASRILIDLIALSKQALQEQELDSESISGVISRTSLRLLMSALHIRDAATVRHSRNAATIAVGIAQQLGWEGRELHVLEVATLLHDVGKIGIPDNILYKPGKLSPDETDLMSLHEHLAIDVLQAMRVDQDLLEIISQSRSHFNGATDGNRRVGFEIHQGARILSVADAYDSLATDQVYRDAKPHDEIMSILVAAAGTQFDGNVIGALQRWVETNKDRLAQLHGGTSGPPILPEDSSVVAALPAVFNHLYQLESLYDGFFVLDAEKKFVVWSCGAEALLGIKACDMLHQTWSSYRLLYADQSGEQELHGDESPLQQVLNTGKATTNSIQVQRQDGKWINVELQSVPLIDQHGQIQGAVEIFQDQSSVGRGPYAYRELKLKASSDALTSLANRGELETQLMLMVSEFHKRTNHSAFSVLFLDIDYFKSINDIYGHAVGDRVLVEIARLLENETYSGELIGRYGGEEFVVLCPDTDIHHAIQRAERLRGAIWRHLVDGVDLKLTASFGVAEIERGDSADSIIRRADAAMYQSKRLGRNRVSHLSSDTADDQSPDDESGSQADFCFRDCFYACVAKELIVHKLGGFIDEVEAKLVEVAPTRAVLRVGAKGLLPFWGTNPARQPVELEMEFAPMPRMPRAVSSRVCVTVWIRPLGWIRDPLVFQLRAKSVYKIFKEYFAAE